MDLSDWISIISIIVAIGALVYSILSNTKKYELTYHPITKTMNGKALKRRRKKRVRIFPLQDTISIGQPQAIR